MSTKRNKASEPMPALGPADVRISGPAAIHLKNTIGQITADTLGAGLRAVNVPAGQANAIKDAFMDPKLAPEGEGWTVEIHKCNGLVAELRFRAPDDPPIKEPTPEELVIAARRALVETLALIPLPRPGA